MRILCASRAFICLTAHLRATPRISSRRPAEPHARAIERLGGIVIHRKQRTGAACAFVAHELPVGACPSSALIGDRNHRLYVYAH